MANEVFQEIILILCIFILLDLFTMVENNLFLSQSS